MGLYASEMSRSCGYRYRAPVSTSFLQAGHEMGHEMAAADRSGATKVQHYVFGTRGGAIDAASLSVPAAYLSSVQERSRRRALAQWRTGSFWGLEETGRWQQLPREQRICPPLPRWH